MRSGRRIHVCWIRYRGKGHSTALYEQRDLWWFRVCGVRLRALHHIRMMLPVSELLSNEWVMNVVHLVAHDGLVSWGRVQRVSGLIGYTVN